mgnify:CR=1 FL=1
MDLGLALRFVFEDEDWLRKVLINGLIGLIPVVGQIYLVGWCLEVARQVALDQYTVLPDMDFGLYLRRGFQIFVAGLAYSLPVWILVLPMVIIPVLGTTMTIDEDTLAAFMGISSLCCSGLIIVYAIFLGLIMQVVYAHVAVEDSLKAAFEFPEIFRLFKAAIGPWLLAFVGVMVAGFAASLLGSIACGIGIVFTMAIYFPVMGHLYGQAYRQAKMAPSLN